MTAHHPGERNRPPLSARAVAVTGVGLLVGLAAAVGCTERPKAPPLVKEAVYQNDKLGLRLLVPEGWSVVRRSELPSSTLPKPVTLVGYQLSKGDSPAALEVLAADLPDGTDLGKVLIEHQIGAAAWTLKPPPEPVTINGVAATRYVLSRSSGKSEARREATAFRRGDRVFFFIITYATNDPASRDAARQSVQSVTWSQ